MRQCRPGVADKEDSHQKEGKLVALEILGQGSDQGSSDGINQGKYGDQVAQAAEGGIYFPGNIRQIYSLQPNMKATKTKRKA